MTMAAATTKFGSSHVGRPTSGAVRARRIDPPHGDAPLIYRRTALHGSRTLRDLLGHHYVQTTEVYLHTGMERKRAAVELL